jgi:hypothetical protein
MKLIMLLAAALSFAQAPPLTKADQLQDAARKGDAVAVKRLLDEGVDVNTKFRYNATAIFYACDAGHVEVVKVLLDKGADLTVKDSFYGFTPLMLAVSPARKKTAAHKEVVKLLIAKGAPGRETVLGAAVGDGDAEMVKTILDAGPLPAANLTDALEAAKTAKKDDIIAILEKAGAKPFEDFKVDPALLAKFPGTYKAPSGNELTIVAAGARLTIGPAAAPPAQRLTLVATGDTAFKGIGAPIAIAVTFQVEGDKVTGFQLSQGGGPPTTYTRVEGK